MRIVPSTYSLDIKSNAEKKTFGLLQQMDWPDPCICFHSLRLSEHHYKRTGELDFVILCREGLFVLEVKGGGVRRDDAGIWTITDRYMVAHKKYESPFQQALSGMYSLLDSIKAQFPGQPLTNMTIGYGVVFPDCTFDIPSVEWAPEMIIDRRGFGPTSFKTSFKRLVDYWRNKTPKAHQLDHGDVEALSAFLRPKFDLAVSLSYRAGEIDTLMVALTSQQYEKLDAIESNHRIICAGGAGTGKTFMALDVARRLVEQGKKTLFLCKSPTFCQYIGARIDPGVQVRTFEEIDPAEKYDAVILDEAQDALNFEDLAVIDRILTGGLRNGIWRMFLDKNNQAGLSGRYEEAAMDMLALYHPVKMTLSRNCRNTEPIVNAVKHLTALDIGVATAGDGPKVQYHYASGEQDSYRLLEKELDRLFENEVAPGDISLVSVNHWEDSIVSKLDDRFKKRLTTLKASNAGEFPFQNMSFSTVGNFKGLENKFVFLVDFSAENFDQTDMAALYVAMTRPRAGLAIILPETIKPLVSKILIDNLSIIEPRT